METKVERDETPLKRGGVCFRMFWLCYDSKRFEKFLSLPKMTVHLFLISERYSVFFDTSFLLNNYPISHKTLSSKENQNFVPILEFVRTANISLAKWDFINQLQIWIQVSQLCFLLPKVAFTEKESSSLQSESDHSSTEFNNSSNLTLRPYVILYDSIQLCISHMESPS